MQRVIHLASYRVVSAKFDWIESKTVEVHMDANIQDFLHGSYPQVGKIGVAGIKIDAMERFLKRNPLVIRRMNILDMFNMSRYQDLLSLTIGTVT